jgi:hypothetical protein
MIRRPWHGSARFSVGLTRLIPSRADRLGMLRIPVLDAWPWSKKERQTTSLLTTNVPYKEPAERLGAAHAALIYGDLGTSDRVRDPRRCTQASAVAASMRRSGASSPCRAGATVPIDAPPAGCTSHLTGHQRGRRRTSHRDEQQGGSA